MKTVKKHKIKKGICKNLQSGMSMKKLLVTLLLASMAVVFVGCKDSTVEEGPSDVVIEEDESDSMSEEESGNSTTGEENVGIETDNACVSILADIWNAYAEDEKFAVMGGDFDNIVNDAPGAVNINNTEHMGASLQIPGSITGDVDEGAALTHALNANTFTSASLHLKDAANADTFIGTLKDGIVNTNWMCGFPDTLVVYLVKDEYVVYAYGKADIIDTFKSKVSDVYGEDAILFAEENLVF